MKIKNLIYGFFLSTVVMLLAACGGEMSDGGANASNSSSARSAAIAKPEPSKLVQAYQQALTFTPSVIKANYAEGTSATISFTAAINYPGDFSGGGAVYVYVVDSQQVLNGSINLSQIDALNFAVTVYTSASKARGRYTGNFQVQLCKDVNCYQQYYGSPVPLPYDITVTPNGAVLNAVANSSTQATMHRGAAAPAAVTVSITGESLVWSAATTASWLTIQGGAGSGNGSFTVSYAPGNLAVGLYTANVTVTASDGQTEDINFSLNVLPTEFVLTSGIPTFTAVNGAPILAQTLAFELNSNVTAPWTAIKSAPWMLTSALKGTTPGGIKLRPDPSIGPLASGLYSSNTVLSSPGIPNKTVTSNLTLVKAKLSVPSTVVTIGGSNGRDFSPKSLNMQLDTKARAWPWTISALPTWLTTLTPSGMVNETGTKVNLSPKLDAVTPGSVSGTVTITAQVNGDTVNLPITVNLNADKRKLLASEWGVGFSSTPTGTALRKVLKISDNFNQLLPWTAVSSSPWLSVTASGDTGDASQLTLLADPATLPNRALSYATVTVSAADNQVAPAVINIALWKDTNGAAALTTLPIDYSHIVADKIRPYIYAHNGGASIDIYNAYTAKKIKTVPDVGAALGAMTVSPDGKKLYALDKPTKSMAVLSLPSMTKLAPWTLVKAVDHRTSVQAVRVNGVDIVLVGDGTAYLNGKSLGNTGIYGSITASANGRRVFTQDSGYSPAGVNAFAIDYSAIAGGTFMVTPLAGASFINGASNGQDIATNAAGNRLYTASGAPYRCSSVSPTDLSFIGSLPGGDAYPNNAEVTSDGRPICGISGWYSTYDFWVHSPAGAIQKGYKVAGYAQALKPGLMVVTPDSFIVVAQTDDPRLAFVAIGP